MSQNQSIHDYVENEMKKHPVKDMDIAAMKGLGQLVEAYYQGGGFSAKKLAVAAEVMKKMVEEQGTKVFLSFPACIMATGLRGVIRDLVKWNLVDVIITTCGTLDHDIARVLEHYYHGSFHMDDRELYHEGVNRLGNILVPNESYGVPLEKFMQPILAELWNAGKTKLSTRELCQEFGRRLDSEDSVLYWAERNKVPIYVPGITDGAFGSQLWLFYQRHRDFTLDLFRDEQELSDLVFEAKRTGALMIGGGISKHHTIWWNQFRDGLDYAVYLTTAVEHDGSLSGARLREAVSWGKVRENARYVTVEGDATLTLPLGGNLDTGRHSPLEIEIYVKTLSDGNFTYAGGTPEQGGPTAVLVIDDRIHVVVTSRPVHIMDRSLFQAHGLEPATFDLVAVKSPNGFRPHYESIAAAIVPVDAPGATSANLRSLPYQRCVRPIFPLDAEVAFSLAEEE